MLWLPTASCAPVVVNTALVAEIGAIPKVVLLVVSVKVTVPVAPEVTVAVNCTPAPKVEGVPLVASTVLEAVSTFCAIAALVEGPRLALPP